MNWFEAGLKELGLNMKEYENLKPKNKKDVDDLLEEMGHL